MARRYRERPSEPLPLPRCSGAKLRFIRAKPFAARSRQSSAARTETLRKALNLGASDKITVGQFESLLTAAAKSGSTHDLLDLWSWDIPTLSEYGQGISRQLVFYVAKFLSVPGGCDRDPFRISPRRQCRRLAGDGRAFHDYRCTGFGRRDQERIRLKSGADATLYLYELGEPNLGTFSRCSWPNSNIRRALLHWS